MKTELHQGLWDTSLVSPLFTASVVLTCHWLLPTTWEQQQCPLSGHKIQIPTSGCLLTLSLEGSATHPR